MFFRTIALLVIVSFVLHLVWEFAHYRLYTGYEDVSTLPIYLWATVGDVLYTLAAFALASGFKKSIEWVREASLPDFIGLLGLGFFISLYVEYKAFALGRWAYLPEMPLVPGFEVGLSPILQMTILLPLTVFILSVIERRLTRVY